LDTLPVDWFSVFGNDIFLLFAVRTISVVTLELAQSVNARSTYMCDEKISEIEYDYIPLRLIMREPHEAWRFDQEHQEYFERHRSQKNVHREFEQ
jgi:hypothetical protein